MSLPPIEIPRQSLSPEALSGLVESFILREGTDYGAEEIDYDTKFASLMQQLQAGDIKIFYDPNTESVGLVAKADGLVST